MKKYKVAFLPDQKRVEVDEGATLLEAAEKAGVYLNSLCLFRYYDTVSKGKGKRNYRARCDR